MTPTSPEIKPSQPSAPESQPSISERPPKGAVDETTFEAAGQMKPESKKFFRSLFDRIKSSDVVQNITDRYQVWRDERLAQRGQGAIDRANGQQQCEQERAAAAQKASERSQADLKRLEEIMSKMGKKVSEEDYVKVAAETIKHGETQLGHQARAQQISGQIEDLRLIQTSFTEQAEQANGRLDGRLEAKMNINNKSIEEYGQREARLDLQIASNEAGREKNAQHEIELESLLEILDRSDAIRPGVKRAIQEVRRERARLEEVQDLLVQKRDSIKAKMFKLENKNNNLSAKREQILPTKQRRPVMSNPAKQVSPEEVVNPAWVAGEGASRDQTDYEAILDYEASRGNTEGSEPEQASATDRQSSELSESKAETIRPEIDRVELMPSTARRGEIIITTADGRTRKLTHKYSDLGPCMIESNLDGSFTVKLLDKLTDEDLKPFGAVSSKRLKLMGLGVEIAARMAAIEGADDQDNKFLIGNLTFDWNKMVGKKSGLQIELPRRTDPTMSLENGSSAKEYILKALAKKLVPGADKGNITKLNKKIVAMVDRFLKSQ